MPPMYEIRVEGVVSEADLRDVGAVAMAPDRVSTVVYGIADQSALYGLLDRLQALGIEVLEVRRVSAPPAESIDEGIPETHEPDPSR